MRGREHSAIVARDDQRKAIPVLEDENLGRTSVSQAVQCQGLQGRLQESLADESASESLRESGNTFQFPIQHEKLLPSEIRLRHDHQSRSERQQQLFAILKDVGGALIENHLVRAMKPLSGSASLAETSWCT